MELLSLRKIILPNRDGARLHLLETEPESNLYKLVIDDDHRYILDYLRIIFEEDNITINAVDPSGGPYLNVGKSFGYYGTIQSIFILDDELMFLIKK